MRCEPVNRQPESGEHLAADPLLLDRAGASAQGRAGAGGHPARGSRSRRSAGRGRDRVERPVCQPLPGGAQLRAGDDPAVSADPAPGDGAATVGEEGARRRRARVGLLGQLGDLPAPGRPHLAAAAEAGGRRPAEGRSGGGAEPGGVRRAASRRERPATSSALQVWVSGWNVRHAARRWPELTEGPAVGDGAVVPDDEGTAQGGAPVGPARRGRGLPPGVAQHRAGDALLGGRPRPAALCGSGRAW